MDPLLQISKLEQKCQWILKSAKTFKSARDHTNFPDQVKEIEQILEAFKEFNAITRQLLNEDMSREQLSRISVLTLDCTAPITEIQKFCQSHPLYFPGSGLDALCKATMETDMEQSPAISSQIAGVFASLSSSQINELDGGTWVVLAGESAQKSPLDLISGSCRFLNSAINGYQETVLPEEELREMAAVDATLFHRSSFYSGTRLGTRHIQLFFQSLAGEAESELSYCDDCFKDSSANKMKVGEILSALEPLLSKKRLAIPIAFSGVLECESHVALIFIDGNKVHFFDSLGGTSSLAQRTTIDPHPFNYVLTMVVAMRQEKIGDFVTLKVNATEHQNDASSCMVYIAYAAMMLLKNPEFDIDALIDEKVINTFRGELLQRAFRFIKSQHRLETKPTCGDLKEPKPKPLAYDFDIGDDTSMLGCDDFEFITED